MDTVHPKTVTGPKQKWFWRILGGLVLVTLVVLAWYPLPLDHHGMIQNHAAAVGRLRTIHVLEEKRDVGYTCRFGELKGLSGATSEASTSLPYSGFNFTFQSCVTNAQSRITGYTLVAVPLELDRSGKFAFCENQSGTIYFAKDGSAETCLSKGKELN